MRLVRRPLIQISWIICASFVLVSCVANSGGPPRLYPLEIETQLIRDGLSSFNLREFNLLQQEADRVKYRNDWIAARMYAIDIQYTPYESGLTRERQNVDFGAAATTLGLTTASGLVAPVATKNLLTGLAGFVTGTRAAYDNEILLAHSTQWIQSQMRTQRSLVGSQIFESMKRSTSDYTLAEALTDIEEYYRAGTLTGGILGTSDTLGAEARFAESVKAEKREISYVSTAAGQALQACILRTGSRPADQRARLKALMKTPSEAGLAELMAGQSPAVAEGLLRRARMDGICS